MNLNFGQLIVLILILTLGTVSGILVNANLNPNVQVVFDVRHPVSVASEDLRLTPSFSE